MKNYIEKSLHTLKISTYLSGLLFLSACSIEETVDRVLDAAIEKIFDFEYEYENNISQCLPETEAKDFADSAIDDLIAQGLSFSASASETPFYRFKINQAQAITISASGTSADPTIALFDAAGNIIEENDDYGDSYNSKIPLSEPLAPGEYCINVAAINDDDIPIQLSINSFTETDLNSDSVNICLPETPAKNFAESAIDSLLEDGLSHSASVTETPFYRFSIDHSQKISISASNESADPLITVYDADGNDIAENDDYGGSYNSRINFRSPLEAGTYCIGIKALEGDHIPVTTSINTFDINSIDASIYDAVDEVPPLNGNYPVSQFEYTGSHAIDKQTLGEKAIWYRIDVDTPSIYFIESNAIKGSSIDPQLNLFDSEGNKIAYNDDALSTDSLLAARLEPKTYLLAMSQAEEAEPDQVQITIERYAKVELK